MDVLVRKTVDAAVLKRKKKLGVLAGGVAAKLKLREMLGAACEKQAFACTGQIRFSVRITAR